MSLHFGDDVPSTGIERRYLQGADPPRESFVDHDIRAAITYVLYFFAVNWALFPNRVPQFTVRGQTFQ